MKAKVLIPTLILLLAPVIARSTIKAGTTQRSPSETCAFFANETVKRFGDDLAKIGEAPADIRQTVKYTCLDAIKTALEAQSPKEIDQWRIAKLNALWGVNPERDNYKAMVIKTSSNIAQIYYNDKVGVSVSNEPASNNESSISKAINKSDKYDGDTLIVNHDKKYVAVVSYNIEGGGCETRMHDMTISEIVLDREERHIEAMRFKEHPKKLEVNFSGLDNASRSWADSIFKTDDKVSVNIMLCGSGGYESMIGIAKPMTSGFPTAGVQISPQN